MKKNKEHRLSKTEKQIMDFFWDSEKKEIMARDVLQHFYEHGKTWNQQNVANYLKNLQNIGILQAEVRNGKYYYYPTMTRQEYRLMPARNILEQDFNGSYGALFCALMSPYSSEDELARLKKILDDYTQQLEEQKDNNK